jgi:hypothetical protein
MSTLVDTEENLTNINDDTSDEELYEEVSFENEDGSIVGTLDNTLATHSSPGNVNRTFIADEGFSRIIFNHIVVDK